MGGNANTDLFIYAHVADLSGAAPHVLPFCILARPCSLSDQKYGFYSSTGIPVPLPILKDMLTFHGFAFSTRGELSLSPSIPVYRGMRTAASTSALSAHTWVNAQLTLPITKKSKKGGTSPQQNPEEVGSAVLDGKLAFHTTLAGQSTGFGVAGMLVNLITGNTDISDLYSGTYKLEMLADTTITITLDLGALWGKGGGTINGPSLNIPGNAVVWHKYEGNAAAQTWLTESSYNFQATLTMGQIVDIFFGSGIFGALFNFGSVTTTTGLYVKTSNAGVEVAIKGQYTVRLLDCNSGVPKVIKDLVNGVGEIAALTMPDVVTNAINVRCDASPTPGAAPILTSPTPLLPLQAVRSYYETIICQSHAISVEAHARVDNGGGDFDAKICYNSHCIQLSDIEKILEMVHCFH